MSQDTVKPQSESKGSTVVFDTIADALNIYETEGTKVRLMVAGHIFEPANIRYIGDEVIAVKRRRGTAHAA